MAEPNENFVIELPRDARIRLRGEIVSQMEKIFQKNQSVEFLKLCDVFLSGNWPEENDCEILLSGLVILAKKLKMRIVITNLFMEPRVDA
jgi:hypothetical protein